MIKQPELNKSLLTWYIDNNRDLPWRRSKDPYSIWISEIMLQQTRVDTVIDYYLRFLGRFPDVVRLAGADEEEVLSLWSGLGYYTRGRNLHQAAKIVLDQYNGIFPDTYSQIRALPGIGDYTAGAIMSIAFNKPYPAVDGNVLRVISRINEIDEEIHKPKVKKQIKQITAELISEGKAGEFNQALMELGATLCIPKNPRCSDCPLQAFCKAHLSGRQHLLPVTKKAKSATELAYWVAVVHHNGNIMMEYRNNTNLLGHMWGFPMVMKSSSSTPEKLFDVEHGLQLQRQRSLGTVKHVFTHQIWHMEVIEFSLGEETDLRAELAWMTMERYKDLAVPKAFQKVFDLSISLMDNSLV